MTLNDLHNAVSSLSDTPAMPVLFVGHGSPMNALENNEFTKTWENVSNSLPNPRAIVCISAHWETRGTFVTADLKPKTIHDFYGFPQELYKQGYPASGSPELARDIIENIENPKIEKSLEWGLDHGAWSVLKYFYPNANIPVIQISIDHYKDTQWHYDLAMQLAFLRTKGVLVVGSGNMVHNLRMIQLKNDDFNTEYGYDWAFELNDIFKKKLLDANFQDLINYRSLHDKAGLAIPTPEHYIPMLYALGMTRKEERIKIFNDKVIAGSLSMTSFIIGEINPYSAVPEK